MEEGKKSPPPPLFAPATQASRAQKTFHLALYHLNRCEFPCRLEIFERSFSRTAAIVSNVIPSDWRDASKPIF